MGDEKPARQQSDSLVAVIIFFVLLFVFSKWGPAVPFSVLSQSKGEPMVVTGEGKAVAIPDIVKVSAGIQEQGTTLNQVQDTANKKSQSLVEALKKMGVEDKDIKTSSYNVSPQSDYQVSPPKITGYQVSISYEVTVRNIDKTNDILTTLTSSGANLIGGVSFDLSDEAKAKAMDSARNDAVDKAKENAQSLAKSSGIKLGKIINVTESQGISPRPVYMTADKAVGLGGAPISPDIQPGTTDINVIVSLSYEVR
ncbi:MAG TPA: SIMPL domain-containing protein [Patescibacteria group bacterium]|nr:SIMPL domain-containing protein [Patescibacteria group bacterium]